MNKILLFIVCYFLSLDAYAVSSFGTAVANVLDSGLTNAHYTLSGNHFAFVYNDSNVAASFVYTFQLCSQTVGCRSYPFSNVLPPHVGINVYFTSNLDALYTTQGQYTITASTTIVGPSVNVIATGNSVANIIPPLQY